MRAGPLPRPGEADAVAGVDASASASGMAVIGVAGRQTLRKSASEAIETMAATMSTSHGPWKFDTAYWGIAKERPATRMGGQTSSVFLQPTNAMISQNGTITEKNGSCRPTMPLSSCRSRPVTAASAMMGVPSAPKATGAVLAMSDKPDAASGLKPRPMSIAAVTATGVPKPCRTLEEGAEAEGDEQQLQAPVVADGADRTLQNRELPLFARELIEENDVEDDPTDGEQPERRAIGGGKRGHRRRHPVAQDGDREGCEETEDRRYVRAQLEDADTAQQHDDREGGDERGEEGVAEGVIDLRPHASAPLNARPAYSGAETLVKLHIRLYPAPAATSGHRIFMPKLDFDGRST